MTYIILFRIILNNSCLLFRIVLNLPLKINEVSFFRNTYILKLFSILGLSILLLNIVNKSIYTHTHQLENGEIVIHAHPFNQDNDNAPIKSHHHTSLEFLVLSTLDVFNISVFLFPTLKLVEIASPKYFFHENIIKQRYFHFKQNKSPPILNSI